MSAPLTSAGAAQQLPTTQQSLQPTSLDESRNVERREPTPPEYQIQGILEPSSQSQASNELEDHANSVTTAEILEYIMEIREMQKTGEAPELGAVLDRYA